MSGAEVPVAGVSLWQMIAKGSIGKAAYVGAMPHKAAFRASAKAAAVPTICLIPAFMTFSPT